MNAPTLTLHNLGYPRIGARRELKFALESYWSGETSETNLLETGEELRLRHWQEQETAGLHWIPSNDFSFYDHVLDTTLMVGNLPPRFRAAENGSRLQKAFFLARGRTCLTLEDGQTATHEAFACEMTKWFDTNYHYIVPEFHTDTRFSFADQHIVDSFIEAKENGIQTKPILLGPVSYLLLGKSWSKEQPEFEPLDLLDRLLPVYRDVLQALVQAGAEWVQIDEPALAKDLSGDALLAIRKSQEFLNVMVPDLKILLTYGYDTAGDALPLLSQLPVAGIHVDAVAAKQDAETLIEKLPPGKILSLGLVSGRNIWRTDYASVLPLIKRAVAERGQDHVWLAPATSLLHVPHGIDKEETLPEWLIPWLAFASEKINELQDLGQLALQDTPSGPAWDLNQRIIQERRESPRTHNPAVRERLRRLPSTERNLPVAERLRIQREKLNFPLFPTTTIGSFPQTKEVRAKRAAWRGGKLSDSDYRSFLEKEIADCVAFQEEIGIDMPVHGEFERNDMVEYFGEQLDGFAFSRYAWVQSYGSRCVKPPILYGDVFRPKPMTTEWTAYAQTLTDKPMKGMLTGPVTILQWSFVRDDQPRELTARQIALAIRDEVLDLEAIGTAAIQIDEPAFREGLPLRQADWEYYLAWGVECFRLCAAGVRDDTQIHTHMCYSEFNDIIESIAAMDADVITIETSRSNMELLDAFVNFKYPADIGPGVYDIHSPRIPNVEEMTRLLNQALAVLPLESIWVNPDCGLKTRKWEEVKPSLTRMVQAARILREQTEPASLAGDRN